MFNCQICKKSSAMGEKQHKIVTETRPAKHPKRYNKNGIEIDKGGAGKQIVSEVNACGKCAMEATQ